MDRACLGGLPPVPAGGPHGRRRAPPFPGGDLLHRRAGPVSDVVAVRGHRRVEPTYNHAEHTLRLGRAVAEERPRALQRGGDAGSWSGR